MVASSESSTGVRRHRSWSVVMAFGISFWLVLPASPGEDASVARARKILAETGTRGGVVVHLGCGDGRVTAALCATDSYTVHGLEADSKRVARARDHVRSLEVYGRVSVERFTGAVLPYTDNLVNLVVVDDAGRVPREEVMRVLAPGGVASFESGARPEIVRKARPSTIDDWSHFLHDATNNAVANDLDVGPPRRVQWIAPPLWLRSHETPSGIQAPVTAGGRLYYFLDEGLIGVTDERLPDRWSLVCRDAFNGRLLWKRPLEPWGWRKWSRARYEGKDWTKLRAARTDVPLANQRRIVAGRDHVFVTLGYGAPLSILDGAEGRLVATVDDVPGVEEILVSASTVALLARGAPEESERRRGRSAERTTRLAAVDGGTGRVLWQKETGPIRPLAWAIDGGQIVYIASAELTAVDLGSGQARWHVRASLASPRTLLATGGVVVLQGGNRLAAHDATDGALLWQKTVPPIGGGEGADLFVIGGLVWRGMLSVDADGEPTGKSSNVLVTGRDLRTGEEKRKIRVNNLRSPEHHHRCYRNKATARYLISSYEGAEFLDFRDDGHCQQNWLRGACQNGMIPANGMLYVPPDQCFCQPGGKLLGYAAVRAASTSAPPVVPDRNRLEKGAAYGAAPEVSVLPGDWPTFRHDPARRGTTESAVSPVVSTAWKVDLGGPLTPPVAANGRVLVARVDAHTVCALDAENGELAWQFTANGRIDSPPTVHRGLVLFGSRSGYVYCLRADDGQLAWRFLAAPADRRIGHSDQLESAWPVHGSVLVHDGVAYFTAGCSTYLDGGIRVWGLDPATGKILHRGLLEGPHRTVDGERDVAFFVPGANSDVLVAEGGFLYMRQKKMTKELDAVEVPVLSSKGAQDVGLHIFSTSGLLDGSWYNRTFWMYSGRWPGFQLANQAPKAGQLLVVDAGRTYAVRVFYRRNVHSPMFFPGREGYLLFADRNSNEPQIVGEEGSRKPVRWLPQSDYSRGRGGDVRKLETEAFGLDKMIGYTRAEPPLWTRWISVRVRAMVKAGETLFVAGPPDELDEDDPYAAFEGRRGGRLVSLDAEDGKVLAEVPLAHPPVFDGMIAAGGRLFVSLRDGRLVCLAPTEARTD